MLDDVAAEDGELSVPRPTSLEGTTDAVTPVERKVASAEMGTEKRIL